jgi:mannosyltransferase OCH1-like enzyme
MISWMFLLSYVVLSGLLLLFLIKTNSSLRTICICQVVVILLVIIFYFTRYSTYLFEKRKDRAIINKIIPNKNEPLPKGKTLSFSDFLSYDVPFYENNKIPLLFFRTSPFTLDNMPKEITHVLEQTITHHPTSTQVYLDNEDCDFFIHHYYPQYESYYKSVRPGAFKADIIRVLLLYHFGGIYNDIGHLYIEPIHWITKEECVFVKDISLFNINTSLTNFGIHNSFMACYKEHPIMLHIITYILDNVKHKRYGATCLDITGPQAVKKAINKFLGKQASFDLPNGRYKHKNMVLYTLGLTVNYTLDSNSQQLSIIHKNKKTIQCKFTDYYKIMYHNRKTITYPELWFAGLVYH